MIVEPLIDKWELARRLGVSRNTLDRYIAAGLPVIRLSKRAYRFDWAAVQEWMEARGNVAWTADAADAAGDD